MSRFKYYFMPKRWRSFTIWMLKRLLLKLDGADETEPEVYIIEQYMYRYLKCDDCMEAGHCVNADCKCKMPARAHVRSDHCPAFRWGPFKNKERWEAFKKQEQIRFLIIKRQQDV